MPTISFIPRLHFSLRNLNLTFKYGYILSYTITSGLEAMKALKIVTFYNNAKFLD